MNYQKELIKVVSVSIAMTLFSLLYDTLFGAVQEPGNYGWGLLSNLLIVGVLHLYGLATRHRGIQLIWRVFTIYYLIGHFSILIEAVIFNVTDNAESLRMLLTGLPISLLTAILITWAISSRRTEQSQPQLAERSFLGWSGRVLLGNVLYFIIYIAAGMILSLSYPPLLEYYEGKIPPFFQIVVTNLFFRGFIFVGIALLIDYSVSISSWKKAILIGSIFSIVGGIAPLIIPSDLMPQFVRIAHGFEIGISNFLYGVILTLLFIRKVSRNHASLISA